MQNLQIRRTYTDSTANKLVKLVKSGIITLTHEEALEISEKLEIAALTKEENTDLTRKLSCTANSMMKILEEIKGGKDIDEVMKDWSVVLPIKKEDNSGELKRGYILGTQTSAYFGSYFKGVLTIKESGLSYSQKEFSVRDDRELNYNVNGGE